MLYLDNPTHPSYTNSLSPNTHPVWPFLLLFLGLCTSKGESEGFLACLHDYYVIPQLCGDSLFKPVLKSRNLLKIC